MSIDNTEVRVTGASGASKGQKDARFDLIPPEPLRQLAVHYGRGARKYNPIPNAYGDGPAIDNWRLGYNYSSSLAALHRHLNAWSGGENVDEETGSNHLIAVAWHALTLVPGFADAYDYGQARILTPPGAAVTAVADLVAAFGGNCRPPKPPARSPLSLRSEQHPAGQLGRGALHVLSSPPKPVGLPAPPTGRSAAGWAVFCALDALDGARRHHNLWGRRWDEPNPTCAPSDPSAV
ncbi:dATP/dGTP diphosphohydrolase domain-containing protein [Microbacterium gorillae]|uniref:dATP/dGTP diphosphohydrolase domain-containing protein n=1 Tax=Microbacterium gorillae TaxID=1231063 RepID=UPI00058DDEAA|nr:dATP/dGTP diphosphohydrolase domain-containing protein [Microbacterium gorillae]